MAICLILGLRDEGRTQFAWKLTQAVSGFNTRPYVYPEGNIGMERRCCVSVRITRMASVRIFLGRN